jgi:subtilase family serine protease
MPMPPARPRGLPAAFLAVVLAVGLSVSVAVPGAGASLVLGRLLPFGCANPAGHRSVSLLPATQDPTGNTVTCFGQVVRGAGFLSPDGASGPTGYGPSQIRGAYNLTGTSAHGRTVAVVDAYDDPRAEADLAVYRRTFGLPVCTSANGCLRTVNQRGASSPRPAVDYGWAEEISLDLDAVSATCPDCHILLVEADSPSPTALMAAVDTAVRLGASAVSNSYGAPEDSSVLALDRHLNHAGVAITAAAGDDGYGVQWPASSRYVTAVGGTRLTPAINARGWDETAWSGSGSGCSRYEPKPAWQHDAGCPRRTVADVAAVASPDTGLAVYDTLNNCPLALLCDVLLNTGAAQGLNGWAQIGGTSLSAPIVAAVYALAGNRGTASYAYSHRSALTDVRSGANGNCGGSYLCTAKTGFDGPTGLGTPFGLGAF